MRKGKHFNFILSDIHLEEHRADLRADFHALITKVEELAIKQLFYFHPQAGKEIQQRAKQLSANLPQFQEFLKGNSNINPNIPLNDHPNANSNKNSNKNSKGNSENFLPVSLFLIGDIFALAIDDSIPDWFAPQAEQLRYLRALGVRIFFMSGNRDFMLREQAASLMGAELTKSDYALINFGSRKNPYLVFLCHGDTLCLSDVSYLRYRKFMHSKLLNFVAKYTLPGVKNWIANKISSRSKLKQGKDNLSSKADSKSSSAPNSSTSSAVNSANSISSKNSPTPRRVFDLDMEFCQQLLDSYGAQGLICGHVHKQRFICSTKVETLNTPKLNSNRASDSSANSDSSSTSDSGLDSHFNSSSVSSSVSKSTPATSIAKQNVLSPTLFFAVSSLETLNRNFLPKFPRLKGQLWSHWTNLRYQASKKSELFLDSTNSGLNAKTVANGAEDSNLMESITHEIEDCLEVSKILQPYGAQMLEFSEDARSGCKLISNYELLYMRIYTSNSIPSKRLQNTSLNLDLLCSQGLNFIATTADWNSENLSAILITRDMASDKLSFNYLNDPEQVTEFIAKIHS